MAGVRVARLAAEQEGVVDLDELRSCGLSRDAVATRVRNGSLHPVHKRVYAVGHPGLSLSGRFVAAVKACGEEAALSHCSAAAFWGILEWDDWDIDVTVPAAVTKAHPQLKVHRSSLLTRRDVMFRSGMFVTAPAWTVVACASQLNEKPLRRMVRQALSLRLVSVRQILDVTARVGPRRGTRALARILASGAVPTRSELEDVVFDLIVRGGFEPPDVNRPLRLDGRTVIPDFRWPQQRLVIEADGAKWHENTLAREDDAERQALLEEHGDQVLRVTWTQAVTRRRQTQARIVSAGAPPSTESSLSRR